MAAQDRPIKILRLVSALAETSAVYNQFSLPLRARHDISVCTYLWPSVSPPPEITVFKGTGTIWRFFRVLRAALAAEDYDIIHVHVPSLGFLFLAGNLFFRKPLRSTIFTVHNSYGAYGLRNRLILALIFCFFGRVVHCSQSSYESFPRIYKRLAGERLHTVENGVDVERVDNVIRGLPRRLHRNSGLVVMSVGRLIEIKNPFVVAAAFRTAADAESHLVFVGDGCLRDALQARFTAWGIEGKVELTGVIPRDEVYKRLHDADLLVSASRGEGLPIAVLEAMACGCPVILSDIPPHREISGSQSFIPLIAADDESGFAREIKRFMGLAPPQRAAIGKSCRQLAEERFGLRRMHQAYEELYLQMLD